MGVVNADFGCTTADTGLGLTFGLDFDFFFFYGYVGIVVTVSFMVTARRSSRLVSIGFLAV